MANVSTPAGAQGPHWSTHYQQAFQGVALFGGLAVLVSAIARQKFSGTLGFALISVGLLSNYVIIRFQKESAKAKPDSLPPQKTESKVGKVDSTHTLSSSALNVQDQMAQQVALLHEKNLPAGPTTEDPSDNGEHGGASSNPPPARRLSNVSPPITEETGNNPMAAAVVGTVNDDDGVEVLAKDPKEKELSETVLSNGMLTSWVNVSDTITDQ